MDKVLMLLYPLFVSFVVKIYKELSEGRCGKKYCKIIISEVTSLVRRYFKILLYMLLFNKITGHHNYVF